ncbi:ATP-binding protein [Candidatus Amesbacteria bacterium]|nr:ATP-binding protein [Candidatus Amesbacteria bacterium]
MFRQVQADIKKVLESKWKPIILILGARQTGKTTLARSLTDPKDSIRFDFDILDDINRFSSMDRESLHLFAKANQGKYILIDEVQKYPSVTATIKYLYDNFKDEDLKFILIGSSEIKIRQGLGDTLTGRVYEVRLYPLSLTEIQIQSGVVNNSQDDQLQLRKYLIYGSLPASQNLPLSNYSSFLKEYVNSLLSKDILEFGKIRKSAQIFLLAKLLAGQIGQLVNFNELAINTGLSRETVMRFVDIFEQLGLTYRASPISTNERESIMKATKIYFTDLGIRNALINNFEDINIRSDRGQLLENAVFMGLKRELDYKKDPYQLGFFRSPTGSEIDIVKRANDVCELFEIKSSNRNKKTKNVVYITPENAVSYLK